MAFPPTPPKPPSVPKPDPSKLMPPNPLKGGSSVGGATKGPFSQLYEVQGASWYKVFPYVFAIEETQTGKTLFNYALPIPPESIVTQMISPTEVVPTLGGVVEEPSATVFWSIQLAGTMGNAVSRFAKKENLEKSQDEANLGAVATAFRTSLSKTGLLTGMVDSLLGSIDKVNGAINAIKGAGGGLDSAAAAMQAAVQPLLPYMESAVNEKSNGYVEIHNFHRFLIFYTHLNSRKDALSDDLAKNYANNKYGLFFYNYKDNQKFRIVLKNFMIIKSQNSPFLYKYQCQFKGWGLQSASNDQSKLAVDRFRGDLATVNTVTITSALTKTKGLVRNFKSATTDPLGTFLPTPPVI